MNLNYIEQNNRGIIKISGRIDSLNYTDFEKQIFNIIKENKLDIFLDCSSLTYISSAGLRVFLLLQKKMNENNRGLTIINLIPTIKEIFEITGFTSIFNISKNAL